MNISGGKAWVRSSIDSYSTNKLAYGACYHCHLRIGKPRFRDVWKSAWGCLGRVDLNPRLSSYKLAMASHQQVTLVTPDKKAQVTGQVDGNQQPGRWLSGQVL